jgi:phosphocarrier protein HPr
MIITKVIQLTNPMGLHTRPATYIAKMLSDTTSAVFFTHQSRTADAKQVMDLLLLGAGESSRIIIKVEGNDASEVIARITQAFESHFGEQ